MRKILLLFIAVYLTAGLSYSQNKRQLNKEFNKAEELLANENYTGAKPIFYKFLETDSSNLEYNFYTGICDLYTDEPDKSIEHFDLIINDYSSSKIESFYTRSSYYYKASAYHSLYLFDEEVETLNNLSSFELSDSEKQELEKTIIKSNVAKELFFDFKPIIVTRLDIINSDFDDHTPIPTANGKKLYFTSKRLKGLSGKNLSDEGKYYEDIWVWEEDSEPVNMGRPINTLKHDATGGLSLDGKTIFIYRASEKKLGDIYTSSFENGKWSVPKKLGKNINKKKSIERHAALSPDGKTLFFSSDKKGGKGGRDIWMSKIQDDNTWGEPINMNINTQYDEESPYLLADGITLYFSSKGHKSLGGYDIFKCMLKNDGTFSEPENIGFPINTVEDDVFFFPLSDEETAFFTRRKSDNAEIFKTIFPDNTIVVGSFVTGNDTVKTMYPITKCDIAVYSINTEAEPEEYTLNIGKGNYKSVLLPDKDYKFYYEYEAYVFDTEDITLNEMMGNDQIQKNPVLVKIEIGKTEKSKNTLFNENSSDLIDYTETELNLIIQNLKKYPELVVNFSTENYKSEADEVSIKRKETVVEYLKKKEISEDRIYIDLSPREIDANTVEYTIYDTESVKKAIEDKEKALYVPDVDEEFYIIEFENFYFSFNGSKMQGVPFDKLDTLANYLVDNPNAKIAVIGYTDAVGSSAYNDKLAVKRANIVKNYLLKKGAKEDQVKVSGYGEDNPYTLNMIKGKYYEPSKKYNRRVEFVVINQGEPPLKTVLFKNFPDDYVEKKYDRNYKR